MKDKIYTIYVIKERGTPCYIGVTSMSLKERFANHCRNTGHNANCAMAPVIAEHGREHFSIESLIQYYDKKAAYNAEAELTEIYRENYNLYNIDTGTTHSCRMKKVLCVELNKIYESISTAAHKLNINPGGIFHCCNGKCQTAGGYHFQFVN